MNTAAPAVAQPATTMPALPFQYLFQKKEDVGPPKSILLYGPSGTRKTSLTGQLIKLPQFNKILYIDIDNGTEVFANDPEVFNAIGQDFGEPGEKRINIVPIDKTDPNAFGMLKYFLGERDGNGVFQPGAAFGLGYDVIVYDTANVGQEVGVQYLLHHTFSDKNPNVKDTQKAWGTVAEWTGDVAWALQNAKELGVMLAHSKEGAEDGGTYKIKPKFQGSIKDSIAAIPSLVAYLEFETNTTTKEKVLVANVGESDVITSKNRYAFGSRIESFDFATLYAMIAKRREETHTTNPQTTAAPVAA